MGARINVTSEALVFTIGYVNTIRSAIFFGQTKINNMDEMLTIGTTTSNEKILRLDTRK